LRGSAHPRRLDLLWKQYVEGESHSRDLIAEFEEKRAKAHMELGAVITREE
jgi:hypothetical protein